ncbi:MAG TPA: hypothetical protein PLA68_13060, partial [Panacibacter sp.]|nr:hypothetical protein [Panacibacter sp.]
LSVHAYILRHTMYDALLAELPKLSAPCDCFFIPLQKNYNCFITNPPLAWQRKGFSDIVGREMDYPWLQTNEQ